MSSHPEKQPDNALKVISNQKAVEGKAGKIQKLSIKKKPLREFFSDRMQVVQAIRDGIALDTFIKVQNSTPFTEFEWSEFLNISTKTLQRFKKDSAHVFKPIHTEKILELAEVTALGVDVFEGIGRFQQWLNIPSKIFGGSAPKEMLRDSYGKEMVVEELHRIDHGIFA